MALQTEHIDKWVRAYLDEVTVVDSRNPLLFWEDNFPVPGYAFHRSDVRTDLLKETGVDLLVWHRQSDEQPHGARPSGPSASVSSCETREDADVG